MKYTYNPPFLVKRVFSSYQWDSNTNKILITFDDGPIPETTPLILKKLAAFDIKAAFFCVGENIKRYPDLYRRINDEGHLICNHTYNHRIISKLKRSEATEQIKKFNNLIKEMRGQDVLYFRPPHGKFKLSTSSMLREMKLQAVMWSLLTYDYQNDFKKVRFAIDNYLMKNSIIVLHDSNKNKNIIIDSINYIADSVYQKGFQFGETNECLR